MPAILTKTIKNNHFLKFAALILGYGLWLIIAAHQIITVSENVPIYFYNNFDKLIEHEPDHILIELRGNRKALYMAKKAHLGIHIDASKLKSSINYVAIEEQQLLLPAFIQMIDAQPSHIKITAR